MLPKAATYGYLWAFLLVVFTVQHKAHLALIMNTLIYGSNYVIAKEVLDPGHVSPNGLVMLRILTATFLFNLLAGSRRTRFSRKDLLLVVACTLTGVVCNQVLFMTGLKLTQPINASLIMTTLPVIVLVASAVVLKESVTVQKIIGIVLGGIGAAVMITYGHEVAFARQGMIGDSLIFINAIFFGLFLIMIKYLLARHHPFVILGRVFLLGMLVTVPFLWKDVYNVEWQHLPLEIYMAIAFVLVCTTFLTYLFNTYALEHLPASHVGVYVYGQPFVTTIIALSAGRDTLTGAKIIAAALIFAGVTLVTVRKRAKSSQCAKN